MRIRAALLAAVALSGCAYHLRVESFPRGAVMTVGAEETTYVLPTDLKLRWKPLRSDDVRFEAPGHRPLAFRLTRAHLRVLDFVTDPIVNPAEAFGDKPRRVLEVRLVPEHGPSGTWTDDHLSR